MKTFKNFGNPEISGKIHDKFKCKIIFKNITVENFEESWQSGKNPDKNSWIQKNSDENITVEKIEEFWKSGNLDKSGILMNKTKNGPKLQVKANWQQS